MPGDAETQVLATVGRQWVVVAESPIGQKKSTLKFSLADGALSGRMTDLFGTLLPISCICLDGNRISWQLDITRPLKLRLMFDGTLDGGVLTGRIRSKFPDIPFSSTLPAP